VIIHYSQRVLSIHGVFVLLIVTHSEDVDVTAVKIYLQDLRYSTTWLLKSATSLW